jgi:hypothetical protein
MYTKAPNVGGAQPPSVLRERRPLAALSLIHLHIEIELHVRSFFWVEDWIIDLQYLCGECQ